MVQAGMHSTSLAQRLATFWCAQRLGVHTATKLYKISVGVNGLKLPRFDSRPDSSTLQGRAQPAEFESQKVVVLYLLCVHSCVRPGAALAQAGLETAFQTGIGATRSSKFLEYKAWVQKVRQFQESFSGQQGVCPVILVLLLSCRLALWAKYKVVVGARVAGVG